MSILFNNPVRLQLLKFLVGLTCLPVPVSAEPWHPWASEYYSENTAWRESNAHFDVYISADLKPGHAYTLSCADYINKQRVHSNRTKNKVLEKIKALLQ